MYSGFFWRTKELYLKKRSFREEEAQAQTVEGSSMRKGRSSTETINMNPSILLHGVVDQAMEQ